MIDDEDVLKLYYSMTFNTLLKSLTKDEDDLTVFEIGELFYSVEVIGETISLYITL